MEIGDKVSVLYMSCNKYSDLWIEYFKLFRRYWADCPFKIYILTDKKGPNVEGVRVIATGEDLSWSDNLLFALQGIKTPYVLLLLDDFLILDYVPNTSVSRMIQWAI